MPERQLPGEAHHQVPGLADIGEVENENEDGDQVAVGDERRRQQRRHDDGARDASARRHVVPARAHARRPIKPCGRSTRTRMSSANENMLFIDGSKKKPASASDTPMRMPPTSAPLIEPSPPTMTMMKASKVKDCASAGLASAMVTIS